jgi:hypothetical protein
VIWLGWRQQRTETLIAVAVLALVAAILVPSGIAMAHAFSRDGVSHCLGAAKGSTCGDVIQSFQQRFDGYTSLIGWFNLVPGLFGVVLAAPLALELEHGTHRLAWTQSITRRRWVATKLGLALASSLLAAAALVAVLVWWRTPFVRLDGRMDNGAFDSQGTVIFGYTLFALGLALAVGAVWRKAVPAVMAAFVGYFVARIFVDSWLRQRLFTPLRLTFRPSPDRGDPRVLQHAWVLSEQMVGVQAKTSPNPFADAHVHVTYFPASDFWALQGIETALFGGIGLALIAFAGWWTLHRE